MKTRAARRERCRWLLPGHGRAADEVTSVHSTPSFQCACGGRGGGGSEGRLPSSLAQAALPRPRVSSALDDHRTVHPLSGMPLDALGWLGRGAGEAMYKSSMHYSTVTVTRHEPNAQWQGTHHCYCGRWRSP